VTQTEYAVGVLLHEFLHTTGKFKADTKIGEEGKSTVKSEYQKKVMETCFPKKKSFPTLEGGMMFKRVLISVAIALVPFHAYGQDKSDKPEWINGVVVAYDDTEASTPCDQGCDRAFIVRLNSEKTQESQHVRVKVKIKKGESFPRELIARTRMWRFKVIRTPQGLMNRSMNILSRTQRRLLAKGNGPFGS